MGSRQLKHFAVILKGYFTVAVWYLCCPFEKRRRKDHG